MTDSDRRPPVSGEPTTETRICVCHDEVHQIIDRKAEARATPPSLDTDVLNAAILDELAELWGEPADSISRQIRPQVARSIVARYLARLTSKEDRP